MDGTLHLKTISNFRLYNDIVLLSPNSTKYKVKINNQGVLSTSTTSDDIKYPKLIINSGTLKYKLIVSDSGLLSVVQTSDTSNDNICIESNDAYPSIFKLIVVDGVLKTSLISSIKSISDHIITGNGVLNSVNGVLVPIGKTLSNKNYREIVSPTSNPNGTLGEVWIGNKTTTNFSVFCSGSTTTTKFDWMLFI